MLGFFIILVQHWRILVSIGDLAQMIKY